MVCVCLGMGTLRPVSWADIAIAAIVLIVLLLIYERLGSIDRSLGNLWSAKWRDKQGLD
jgi:hypothetical protein